MLISKNCNKYFFLIEKKTPILDKIYLHRSYSIIKLYYLNIFKCILVCYYSKKF